MQKKPRSLVDSLLTPEARKAFEEYLAARVRSVVSQMSSSFFAKREIYEKQMNDDFSWRGGGQNSRAVAAELDATSIFDLQNDSLNIVGGFASFMTARAADDIFGTEPYFAISPEGLEDQALAEAIQKHAEWKLRQTNYREAALDAIDLAVGLGEGVLKLHWHREVDVYETQSTVLHVGGQPFLDATGGFLTESDMTPVAPAEDGTASALVTSPKAPELVLSPGQAQWSPRAIEKTNVTFNGVKVGVMHFKDFLCPLTVESLEDSDFVGHRFQMRLSEAKVKFAIEPELVDALTPESDDAKAEKDKPREDETSESRADLAPDPIIEFVECWVKHDPVGDGKMRRLYVLLAMPLGRIVEMDYIANRTPNGQLPFRTVRAYKVKNRWYGKGYYETYANAQDFIDRQLNRIEYRNNIHANPVTFVDHTLLQEEEDADDFELSPGRTFMKTPGAKMEDIIEAFVLPDADERTWELKQLMIQVIQLRSGVTNAAQGEVSSMPAAATATGIESILQSAGVLARMPINSLRECLAKALHYAIELIYANFDRDETYTYFEGEVQRAATLEATRVANLKVNVRLLMTRFQNRDKVETATKGMEISNAYLAIPEEEKSAVRPLYVQALKALGFEHADSIIRQPILLAPPMPGGDLPPEDGMAGVGATQPPAAV